MLNWMERLARVMAIIGGIVLTVLVVLTCVSVFGRGLNTLGHAGFMPEDLGDALIATGVGPITGDFELVEAGVAFSIFSFLPVAQLYAGHATVDIFTSFLSTSLNKIIQAFWEVIFVIVMILITWRFYEGTVNKFEYGETTFLLQFPIWWAYGASLFAACVATITAIYTAGARIAEALTNRNILPYSEGASH
ncbi:TRAP transporter small permease [Pelagimonas varians]|uniref:TRAP transporter small permease protein n=1 Tax=Pelagimonas varians TaxID=696760 RepID=A0A238L235_9RHOB|nr:TRAP transporter small permease subunit [Pelagimonas varians]PYG26711.1 tripartite ATP-independent transporter DctQ subunit [Pelagimonas varians]SMX49144.1 Tripartite ATP-independent periplasmic transporters, DctQ component [Pelagimonas varians]